jgi:hypothetical protein
VLEVGALPIACTKDIQISHSWLVSMRKDWDFGIFKGDSGERRDEESNYSNSTGSIMKFLLSRSQNMKRR